MLTLTILAVILPSAVVLAYCIGHAGGYEQATHQRIARSKCYMVPYKVEGGEHHGKEVELTIEVANN